MMNPLDYSKSVSEFWANQGRALMKAQEQMGAAFSDAARAAMSGKVPTFAGSPDALSAEAANLARAATSVAELWSAATSVCGKMATAMPSLAGGEGVFETTLQKMVDPRSWMRGTGEMDDFLSRMAEGPRFADLWEIERRYAGVLRAWMNVRRCGLEHNAVVLEAWLQAGRRFTDQISGGKQPENTKAALDLWVETANRQLLESQRSDAFLRTQAAMVRATVDLRMAQQELVEHFGTQYGFPTRTELDDVHRTLTELRREMRAMRREQNKSAAGAAKPGREKAGSNGQETPPEARQLQPTSNRKEPRA